MSTGLSKDFYHGVEDVQGEVVLLYPEGGQILRKKSGPIGGVYEFISDETGRIVRYTSNEIDRHVPESDGLLLGTMIADNLFRVANSDEVIDIYDLDMFDPKLRAKAVKQSFKDAQNESLIREFVSDFFENFFARERKF